MCTFSSNVLGKDYHMCTSLQNQANQLGKNPRYIQTNLAEGFQIMEPVVTGLCRLQ